MKWIDLARAALFVVYAVAMAVMYYELRLKYALTPCRTHRQYKSRRHRNLTQLGDPDAPTQQASRDQPPPQPG